MKIGICGAHGTGKSTLALKLAAEHKAAHPYMRVGIVTEAARRSPWPLSRPAWGEAQHWIWHQQFVAELEESRHNNVIVCDRTVLDAAVYSEVNGLRDLAENWRPAIQSWWITYDTVYFLSPTQPLASDGLREMEKEYQRQIHAKFEEMIAAWKLAVIRFDQSILNHYRKESD